MGILGSLGLLVQIWGFTGSGLSWLQKKSALSCKAVFENPSSYFYEKRTTFLVARCHAKGAQGWEFMLAG